MGGNRETPDEGRLRSKPILQNLSNEWSEERVTRVAITQKEGGLEDFKELPSPPKGVRYDPSDRKFLAVSAADPSHPPILQALDSKWWGWREALSRIGVSIFFICEKEIAAKYTQKMG